MANSNQEIIKTLNDKIAKIDQEIAELNERQKKQEEEVTSAYQYMEEADMSYNGFGMQIGESSWRTAGIKNNILQHTAYLKNLQKDVLLNSLNHAQMEAVQPLIFSVIHAAPLTTLVLDYFQEPLKDIQVKTLKLSNDNDLYTTKSDYAEVEKEEAALAALQAAYANSNPKTKPGAK